MLSEPRQDHARHGSERALSYSVRPKGLPFKGAWQAVSTFATATMQLVGFGSDRETLADSVTSTSAFEQVFEVAIVVKRIRLLDVLQNSVHLFLCFAIQFFEL